LRIALAEPAPEITHVVVQATGLTVRRPVDELPWE